MSLPQARRDPNPRSAPGTVVLPQQALADARRQSAPGPAGGQSKKTTSVADKRHQQQTSSVFVHAISVVSKLVFDQARAHPLGIVGVLMGIVGALGAFVLFAVQFFVFQPSWNPAAYQQNNEHMIAAEAALIDATLENQQDKAAQWEEIVSQKNDAFYRQLNRQVAALPRAEQAQFATEAQEKFNREMEALATKHFSVANTSNGPAPGSEAYNQKRVEWSELAPQISTRLHAEKMAKMEALEPGDLAGRSRLETEFEQALQAAATKHFFGGDAGAGTPAED